MFLETVNCCNSKHGKVIISVLKKKVVIISITECVIVMVKISINDQRELYRTILGQYDMKYPIKQFQHSLYIWAILSHDIPHTLLGALQLRREGEPGRD